MSDSWKRYGGLNYPDAQNRFTVGTIIADEVLLREQVAGEFRIQGTATIEQELYALSDFFVDRNALFKNDLSVNNVGQLNKLALGNSVANYFSGNDTGLSVNHNNTGDDLTSHLLPGLKPNGVPKNLQDTVFPFSYNEYDELEKLVKDKKIGVIKMEVQRNYEPKDDFLTKVRSLATKNNIVLIFDECTSGFRETYGGIHKNYNISPDIALFGKCLGNGYPITAILGKKKYLKKGKT